jgi:succinoglycan biosynthesis protein ExoO
MQPTPDVSIVIAAFNAADTIGRAVAGALAQQGVVLELIVADACSTDATREVVAAIADPATARCPAQNALAARGMPVSTPHAAPIAVLMPTTCRIRSPERMIAEAEGAQIVVDNSRSRPTAVRRSCSTHTNSQPARNSCCPPSSNPTCFSARNTISAT